MCWPSTTGLLMDEVLSYVSNGTPSRERPCQVLNDVVIGLRVKPGKNAKEDNEPIRQCTAVVLLAYDGIRPPGWTPANAIRKCESNAIKLIVRT